MPLTHLSLQLSRSELRHARPSWNANSTSAVFGMVLPCLENVPMLMTDNTLMALVCCAFNDHSIPSNRYEAGGSRCNHSFWCRQLDHCLCLAELISGGLD